MALAPHEVARKVLIAYRQLEEIVKGPIGIKSAQAHVTSYDRILETLKECFVVDSIFVDAIKHLRPLDKSSRSMLGITSAFDLPFQMESDGKVLLATAHSFIELYLSPEDKKNAIGFHG